MSATAPGEDTGMTTPEDPSTPEGTPPPDGGYGPPPPGYGPPPPGYGPPPPGYAPAPGTSTSSTPMVLGILGIVFAICCWPIGLVLGILSYTQAGKQPGANKTLGMVAIGLSIAFGLVGIVMAATGHGFVYYRRT